LNVPSGRPVESDVIEAAEPSALPDARVARVETRPPRARDARAADEFAALLARDLAPSYRLAAVILGSEDEAQEATHDAALRAWRHFGQLRKPDRFAAWFGRILVNVCRDRLARRARSIVEVPMGEGASGVPDDALRMSVEREALRAALDNLSPDHRTVIALRYLEDLTVNEIAERTGVRSGTVKSRLHYALTQLRAAYDAAARSPKELIR
jgi:RNA polymerase sigma-70 factor (ECF subfamily)